MTEDGSTMEGYRSLLETATYEAIQKDDEIKAVLGPESIETLILDKSRYPDPTVLSFARWLSSNMIRGILDDLDSSTRTSSDIQLFNQRMEAHALWNFKMGGNDAGLLHADEIGLHYSIEYSHVLPRPFSRERAIQEQPSDKFDSLMGTGERVSELLAKGYLVGITSGTFDVLTSGHIAALHQYALDLHRRARELGTRAHLIVGIDENRWATQSKGDNRPLLNFAQRVGAMCRIPVVGTVFRFPSPRFFYEDFDLEGHFFSLPLVWGNFGLYSATELKVLREKITVSYPGWLETASQKIFFYTSEEDSRKSIKETGISALGGRLVTLPSFSEVHTSVLEEIYELVQQPGTKEADGFVNEPWFQKHWAMMTENLRNPRESYEIPSNLGSIEEIIQWLNAEKKRREGK